MKNTILAVFFLAFSTLCSSFVSPSVASYQKKTSLLASHQETSSYIASDTELLDYDSGMTVRETSLTKNSHSVSLAFSVDGKNSANSYIFGYYGKKEEDSFYPLTCTYEVKDSNGKVTTFDGIVNGSITKEKRGGEGFGYDPIFMPNGYDKTFAELGEDVKNSISHRARAIKKLVDFLQS